MTKLRFLSGLTTIGANVVEISTATSRIIMDFGSTENMANMPALTTMLANHTIPDVPELFTPASSSEYTHEAIFISHLLLDHTGALGLLKSKIPVYFSAESFKLFQSLVASKLANELQINCHQYQPNIPVKIGDLTVTGYESDHDIVGITPLVVSDGQHKFAHSGDFRLNGFHPERVTTWANELHDLNLDVFMTETTSFSFLNNADEATDDFKTPLTEKELCHQFSVHLTNKYTLPVINVYERNIERLVAFNSVSIGCNRPIIWEYAYAQLLRVFDTTSQIHVLAETLPDAAVDDFSIISLNDIQMHQDAYCLHNTFANRQWLSRFNNVIYLHSNGAPLGFYDSNYEILLDDLNNMDAVYIYFGCSGHATANEITELCNFVNAKLTIPWHSFHPELLLPTIQNLNTLLPKYDTVYEF